MDDNYCSYAVFSFQNLALVYWHISNCTFWVLYLVEKVGSHSLSLTNIDFIMILVSANITLIFCVLVLAKPQAMPQMIFYNFYRKLVCLIYKVYDVMVDPMNYNLQPMESTFSFCQHLKEYAREEIITAWNHLTSSWLALKKQVLNFVLHEFVWPIPWSNTGESRAIISEDILVFCQWPLLL